MLLGSGCVHRKNLTPTIVTATDFYGSNRNVIYSYDCLGETKTCSYPNRAYLALGEKYVAGMDPEDCDVKVIYYDAPTFMDYELDEVVHTKGKVLLIDNWVTKVVKFRYHAEGYDYTKVQTLPPGKRYDLSRGDSIELRYWIKNPQRSQAFLIPVER